MDEDARPSWPVDARALAAEQRRLACLHPPAWLPPDHELRAAGCFLAFRRGLTS